jgi:spore coat protein U-like protein
MLNSQLVRRAFVLVLGLVASAAFAADNQTLNVSATVTGTCKLISVPPMSFTLDPTSASNGAATSNVTYRCTKGTAPTGFTVGGASAATGFSSGTTAATGALVGAIVGNTDVLPYSISWTAPSTAGSGMGTGVTPVTVALSGSIANSAFINATADTYSGSVAVVINP